QFRSLPPLDSLRLFPTETSSCCRSSARPPLLRRLRRPWAQPSPQRAWRSDLVRSPDASGLYPIPGIATDLLDDRTEPATATRNARCRSPHSRGTRWLLARSPHHLNHPHRASPLGPARKWRLPHSALVVAAPPPPPPGGPFRSLAAPGEAFVACSHEPSQLHQTASALLR